MEDLLLSDAGGGNLGLNIVCEEHIKPSSKPKRAKKFNKYEKRRAKARKAKQESDEKHENDESATVTKEESVDTHVNEEKEEVKNESKDVQVTEHETGVFESPSKPAAARQLKEDDITSTTFPIAPPQPQQQLLPKSRKVHSNETLENEEERARYMREFHARPREMDRRSGATSHIAPSRESSHLFDSSSNDDGFATLHPRLQSSLIKMNIQQPTIIQTRAIHALLRENMQASNLFIQCETGSGKTLAYLLPILQSLAVDTITNEVKQVDRQVGGTRCIILCPTRELASQTCLMAEKLCSHSFSWLVPGCLSGGEKRKSEKARIRKGISVLVATPGRLLDHLQKTESLLMSLKGKLEWLVLDEADRLLDMGLGGQVQQIVQYIRANQPKSGPKRNGVTWNSILVSATVTSKVQELGKSMLGGDTWLWARGTSRDGDGGKDQTAGGDTDTEMVARDESTDNQLADSTPRQLGQLHITVSAKLRLATLIAFLVQRVHKNERTVVFMSTCDGVDYHEALFTAMDSILSGDDQDDTASNVGIFGKACPIYKLHGNVPHAERHTILQKFGQGETSKGRAALLLATDVAARGLNLPGVDWTVQYDPPCEVADYAHRAGRAARAGKGGHSLLFLLPSERAFLDVLEMKGCKTMTALSLTSTLNEAAKICADLEQDGEKRSGGGYGTSKAGRSGEAFCAEIQHRLEDCVMDDDAKAKTDAASAAKAAVLAGGGKRTRKKPKKEKVEGQLLGMARSAYTSYLRSYPTKEKAVRHIFSARALHLGHVARSFALKEPPKALVKAQVRSEATISIDTDGRKRKNTSLAFVAQDTIGGDTTNDSEIARQIISKKPKHSRDSVMGTEKRVDNKEARALLHARASRLQGMDAM